MSKKPRVDINSLPPEIVSQIVQHIIDLDIEEREELARNPFGDRLPFDMAPNGLLEALLGAGGLGGLLNLGAHQPPAPPVNPAGFDDMPALEDVSDDEPPPPARAPPVRTAASAPARAVPPPNPVRTGAQRPIDLDSMPPLESISSDEETPAPASRSTPAATTSVPRLNGRPLPAVDSDDEMPSLEAIPRNPSVAPRQPTPARTSAPAATNRNANRAPLRIVDSDEDLPPLEDIAAPVRSTASKPNHSADSDMPELEPIDDVPSTSKATPQASGSTTSPVMKKAFAFSFPKAGTAGKAKAAPAPAPAPPPAQPFSFSFPAAVPTPAAPVSAAYSEMPALEDISDDDPPDAPLPSRQSVPQARRPIPSARSSEDDLPPLESIPSAAPKATPKKKPAAKKPTPASTGGLSNAYDDMPSLEGISSDEEVAAPPPPKASKSKKKKKKAAAAVPNDGLPPLEGIDSEDEAPASSKKPISAKAKAQAAAAKSTPSPAPPSTKANNNTTTAGKIPGRYDSDDDLPPLEPIDNKSKGKGKATTSTPAVKPTPAPLPPPPPPVVESSSSDENMPGLDDATESSESESDDSDSEDEKKAEKAADTSDSDSDDEDSDDDNDHSASGGGGGEGGASASEYKDADDYEGDSEGGNGNNASSTSKQQEGTSGPSNTASFKTHSTVNAALEEAASLSLADDQKAVADVILAGLAVSRTSGSDNGSSPDSYEDEEDEEDEDEEWDEDDDEEDDDEDSSDEEVTFKDGLPSDPLLPLIFSKPFLHAARQKLYRNITLKSPYQASLLLRSISAPQHAARDPVEDLDDHISNSKNSLAHMTRSLTIVPAPGEFSDPREGEKDISGGRGGADVYVDIIQLCILLEKLVLVPGFLKSMTKSLLKALENLSRLKEVHLSSGSDSERPLLFTTARIIRLMRYHWPELEALTVIRIAPAEEGPTSEEDIMWMQEGYMNEMEPEAAKAVNKRKGLVTLDLREPNATHNELSIILRDSAMTLKSLVIDNPTSALDRYGLASIILRFGSRLTELTLAVAGNWHPRSKPSSRINPPARVKNYVHGSPSSAMLGAIDNYVYFLDAVVPYLPHLNKLQWDGNLASTTVFSVLPVSLKYINWSHCSAVAPGPLSKLLRKTVNRSRTIQNPDGTTSTKTFRTIVAKGLKCMTVEHDDRTWSDADLNSLNEAAVERGCCLHLSGGRNAGAGLFGGMFAGADLNHQGIPIPIPGGLAAAMGLPVGMGMGL